MAKDPEQVTSDLRMASSRSVSVTSLKTCGAWSRTQGWRPAATGCARCSGGNRTGLSVLSHTVHGVSVRQRLFPHPGQVAGMVKDCQHARFVFNIGLEQRSMLRREGHSHGTRLKRGPLGAPRVNINTQMRELAELRGVLDWLRAGSSSVQQGALRDLDR